MTNRKNQDSQVIGKMATQYPMMVPPFGVVDFPEMTKSQAQQHFEWFVGEVPTRISLLLEAIEASGEHPGDPFDFAPESLKPLWEWLRARIRTVPRSGEKMEEFRKSLPSWILEHVDKWELDTNTMMLATDVSLYFAEVFLRKYPQLKWGFKTKPKRDVYLNKPVVTGFRGGDMHPPTIVVNLCKWHVEGRHDKSLYALYEVWSSFV
jgi:hypothetical protein